MERALLIGALAQAVAGKALQTIPPEIDWDGFLKLARAHNVMPLAYQGLQGRFADVPENVRQALAGAWHKAIFWDAQFDHARTLLDGALAQIDHVYLKGIRLKESYPVSAARTMSDIDVLAHTGDYGRLDQAMASLGARRTCGDGNHRTYQLPGGVSVEMHPNFVHQAAPVGVGVNPGWQYAVPSGEGERTLTPEGFYLSVLSHLANHFVGGGVGVRFVLDIWVCSHLREPRPDEALLAGELERIGLGEFARNIRDLADCWFGTGQMTPLLEALGTYILQSGTYGKESRAVLNAVTLSRGGSRRSALWGKMFYPRQELEDRYPWCKGRPLLLGAAWCARAVQAVKNHGGKIRDWSRSTRFVTRQQVADQRALLESFGIHT